MTSSIDFSKLSLNSSCQRAVQSPFSISFNISQKTSTAQFDVPAALDDSDRFRSISTSAPYNSPSFSPVVPPTPFNSPIIQKIDRKVFSIFSMIGKESLIGEADFLNCQSPFLQSQSSSNLEKSMPVLRLPEAAKKLNLPRNGSLLHLDEDDSSARRL